MRRLLLIGIGSVGSCWAGSLLGQLILPGSLETCIDVEVRGSMAAGIGAAFGALTFIAFLPIRRGTTLDSEVRFHVAGSWLYRSVPAGAVTGGLAGGTIGVVIGAWPPWFGWGDTLHGLVELTAIGVVTGFLAGALVVGPVAGLVAAVVAIKVARYTRVRDGGNLRRSLRWWVGGVLVALALTPGIVVVCYNNPVETFSIVASFALFVALGFWWFSPAAIEQTVDRLNRPDSRATNVLGQDM